MSARVIPSSELDREIEKTNRWFDEIDAKDATLEGHKLDAWIGDVVLSGEAIRTTDGAPTIELVLWDADKSLIQDYLPKERGAVLEMDDRRFTLERTDKRGNGQISLTFEPEQVTWLRTGNKVRKAKRGKVTRAEFIYSLMREVKDGKILFFCPELHRRQPIGTNTKVKRGGIPKNNKLKVKKKPMTEPQRRTCNQVLNACIDLKMPRRAMVSAIACIIQEQNATNDSGGDRDSTGAFQQRASTGWRGDLLDIPNQVKNFWLKAPTTPFRTVLNRYAKKDFGWQISQTQRDYTFGTEHQGKDYKKWRPEAEAIVKAYGGTTATAASAKYEFTRGKSGQSETTWEAASRLSEEVNWIYFNDGRVVFLIDQFEMIHWEPVATITEDDGFEITYTVDAGGKIDSLTVAAVDPIWDVFPGCVIEIDGEGIADGRWLVRTIRKPLFSSRETVTLECKRPARSAAEPASEGEPTNTGNRDDGGAPQKIADLHRIAQIISKNTPGYSLGGGHGASIKSLKTTQKLDCSSSSSLALYRAGMFNRSTAITSGEFARSWGKAGQGEWLTVWANADHVFIVYKYGGKTWRLDTGGPGGGKGPKLHQAGRSTAGFTPRHYPNL